LPSSALPFVNESARNFCLVPGFQLNEELNMSSRRSVHAAVDVHSTRFLPHHLVDCGRGKLGCNASDFITLGKDADSQRLVLGASAGGHANGGQKYGYMNAACHVGLTSEMTGGQ
jgi:hypothetical protein